MKTKKTGDKKSVRDQMPFKTDEEYKAWLLANPRIAEALVDVARELLEGKKDKMSPEKLKEVQALAKEFSQQITGTVVPSQFNAMTQRINELIMQDSFSQEDIKELEQAEEEVTRLINLGLDMMEPDRTKAMKIMLQAKQQIRLVLDNLEEV